MTGSVFIALLRGINVSGANKLPMKTLVALAEARLGLSSVRTYIQSGNVVFRCSKAEAKSLPERMAAEIETECGFRPAVILRSLVEWSAMIAANPFASQAEESAKTVHAYLLDHAPSKAALADLSGRDFGNDRWEIADGLVYLHLPEGVGRSKLATTAERILKVPMTGRNWTSVLAIQALAAEI